MVYEKPHELTCALALGNVGYISWASAVCDVDATKLFVVVCVFDTNSW